MAVEQLSAPMSLKEVMILRVRKERFTRLLKEGKLPFRPTMAPCCACGAVADVKFWSERNKPVGGGRRHCVNGRPAFCDRWGSTTPKMTEEPIAKIVIEDEVLCLRCFKFKYTFIPQHGHHRPGAGTPRPAVPRSQQAYDGYTYYSGEW